MVRGPLLDGAPVMMRCSYRASWACAPSSMRDMARAYYLLLMTGFRPGECYNIGGAHSCTVGEMLNALLALSPKRSEIEIRVDLDRLRPLDADLQVPDCRKFTAHTGWEPTIPFATTMADLLQYQRERIAAS